jgi:RNA polymerase sigma-70 factor (ECF subfamily)
MDATPVVGRKIIAEAIREFSEGPEQKYLEMFAAKLCGNTEEARELVQEAYYRALRFGAYVVQKRFRSWLTVILKNAFFDARRRAASHDVSLYDPAPESEDPLAEVLPDLSSPLGAALEREEARRMVRLALAALPEHHREVVELCDMAGLGYESAARQLGIQVGTVRSRLFRARATLRRSLTSY